MTSPFRGRALAAGALVLPALALAACGSSSKSTSSSPTTGGQATAPASTPATGGAPTGSSVVKVSADASGQLKFAQTALTAKAGTVTIEMSNPASIPHSIAVEGNGVDKDSKVKMAGKGQTATVSTKLKPGKYTFYCPVDGHKQAGMTGTLTVS